MYNMDTNKPNLNRTQKKVLLEFFTLDGTADVMGHMGAQMTFAELRQVNSLIDEYKIVVMEHLGRTMTHFDIKNQPLI